jgi:hypothetical protein
MYMVIHRVNGQSHKDITSRHRHPGVTKRALSSSHREQLTSLVTTAA